MSSLNASLSEWARATFSGGDDPWRFGTIEVESKLPSYSPASVDVNSNSQRCLVQQQVALFLDEFNVSRHIRSQVYRCKIVCSQSRGRDGERGVVQVKMAKSLRPACLQTFLFAWIG